MSLERKNKNKTISEFRFQPKKADGETVPLLLATITLMPVSTKGTEKSIISERSSLMVSEPMAMSARL